MHTSFQTRLNKEDHALTAVVGIGCPHKFPLYLSFYCIWQVQTLPVLVSKGGEREAISKDSKNMRFFAHSCPRYQNRINEKFVKILRTLLFLLLLRPPSRNIFGAYKQGKILHH
jgi:hypothetical protein